MIPIISVFPDEDNSYNNYYTAPADEIFEDVKRCAIQIRNTYDDTYGYASEKINRIKDLENIRDNTLHMVAMFDSYNKMKLYSLVTEQTREWLKPFLVEYFNF